MVQVWTVLLVIPLATTFLLPVLVFQVLYEKEGKLRASLFMSGLKVHVYWVVQYLIGLALALFVLLVVYTALTAGGAEVYTKHSFGIVLLLLVLWANAMVALSFLLSVAFSKTRNANISLYLLVFLAVVSSFAMHTVVFALRPFLPAPAYWIWFPPFAYYRGTYLLAKRICSWHEVPGDELQTIYGVLVLQTVLCLLATYYLDQVLPKQYGVRRDPLFCVRGLRAEAKGSSTAVSVADAERERERERERLEKAEDLEGPAVVALAAEDDDVAQECELVLSGGATQAPVRIVEIKKSFGNFKAVDGVTFHCDKGCSAVLGPNGAGKSTVFAMLTGLYSPSAGDAFVAGRSITTDMHKIYGNIGVCPQHDVTYADLTVAEHLLLSARIKGVNAKDERSTVANALGAVSLTEQASTLAGRLSGGQRRRLSIAIAFIGSPAVVFLDEPTTGTDPISRAQVHEIVRREKNKRCVLLTTHLMSEAEKLCDRISIMAHGKLVAVGTAQELMHKYNDGFRITVVVAEHDRARRFIEAQFPGCELESQVNKRIVYKFPPKASISIARFWSAMLAKSAFESGISDWQVSATTLEDVFLAIAKDAEKV